MAFQLTGEQQAAVDEHGGPILVSAAAGSGKTRVLVERLLDRVTGQGADVDRFLVITYTKAAAAELRERVVQTLHERLAQQPADRHLRRQLTLIYRAQISTVHAFCAQLIRENAGVLDLDPDFRLCDEGEGAVLMDQVLSRVLDERYERMEEYGGFAALVDTMSAGRNDLRLMQIVLDIFHRIQSHPDPEHWLAQQEQVWRLEGISDPAQTAWGKVLMDWAKGQIDYCRDCLERALALCDNDPVLSMNYAESIARTVADLRELLKQDSWDGMRERLPVEFPGVGRKRGVEDELSAQRAKSLRTGAKARLDKLCGLFADSGAQVLDDLTCAGPAVCALLALVGDFGRAYAQEKRRQGLVDFSDLEHMAVRLLVDGEGRPTELAYSWGERYDEVMVDEFQDTNQVQNAIFNALTARRGDLFMVGDVKQSIYRFRLADPTIFLHYYSTFAWGGQAREGESRKLVLSGNFRSYPQVLHGVNDVFRDLMSRELGELDYTDDQALVPQKKMELHPDRQVELDVVETGEQTGDDPEDKNLLEARNAARHIRQLLDRPTLLEDGRQLKAEDVMVLMRSPGPVLHHYIRALSEQGIPWSADTGEDFFAFTEINVALSLLQVVDNPRQDVPLISVLRSPVYDFSADRMAQLRARSKGDFYSVVAQAAAEGEKDCAEFLAQLGQLRLDAGERTCSQMVWHVFEQTDLLALFSAMPEGDSRRSHLLALYELARQQESLGCRTLFEFLLRLERLRANNQNIFAGSTAGDEAGVRILTIHRSKGLEAPVVLVCGLGRQFNREDSKKPVLFHTNLGVGPKYLDVERGIELNTIARQAVSRTLDSEMLAEELRLLYVAMTRAREKLILTMTVDNAQKAVCALREDVTSPVSPHALASCNCVGQWVLLSVMNYRSGAPLRRLADMDGLGAGELTVPWTVRVVDGNELTGTVFRRGQAAAVQEEDADLREELTRRYRWQYPYAGAVDVPSKLTATQLKGRHLDQEAAEETPALPVKKAAPLYRPDFAVEKLGLTAAQKGTALHLVLQFMDFSVGADRDGVAREIGRLVTEQYITPEQGEAADPERIAAFFRSPLGQEMLRVPLHREFKFSMLADAGAYYPGLEGEELLLQGVVDCWFEQEDGITVVDFKTDRVDASNVGQRAGDYAAQLDTYTKALQAMTGKPVKRRVLWFFALNAGVEV